MGIGDQYGWVTLADGTSVPPDSDASRAFQLSDPHGFAQANPNFNEPGYQGEYAPNTYGKGAGVDAGQSNGGRQPNSDSSGAQGMANDKGHGMDASRPALQQWIHQNAPQTFGGNFELQPNETAQQWMDRVAASGGDNANFIAKIREMPSFQAVSGIKSAQGMDRQGAINDYYRMMTDPNAPELKAAQQSAMRNAQNSNVGRGLAGGLADASATKIGLDSYNALSTQRAGMGANALLAGMGEFRGASGQAFDQNQSNSINGSNDARAREQSAIAALGQAGAAAANLGASAMGSRGGGGATQPDGLSEGDLSQYTSPPPDAPSGSSEPGTPSWDGGGS